MIIIIIIIIIIKIVIITVVMVINTNNDLFLIQSPKPLKNTPQEFFCEKKSLEISVSSI